MAVPFDVGRNEVTGEAFTVLPDVAVRRIGESMFTVSDNGTMLYSTQVAGGEGRLVEVAVDGSSSDTLPPAVGQFQEPRYSPDGRHIAYAGDEGIWTYDRETGAKTLVVADGGNAVWSPDGRHIYSVKEGVYRASLDTPADSERVVTPRSGQYLWPLSAAPNGGELLLGEWAGGERGINLVVLSPDQGSSSLRPYLGADWHEMAGAISPDGRWVAYSSNESGTWEVYVRRLSDAGGQVRVSSGGGFGPRWAPDGTAIYYVYVAPGGAGSTDREIRRSAVRSGASFQAGPPGIAFRGPFLTSQSVFPAANFDLHPDGSRLLVVQPVGEAVSTQPTVYLVANWFGELRRRAPK
jgi:Tol biopolymer transport system component